MGIPPFVAGDILTQHNLALRNPRLQRAVVTEQFKLSVEL
jgi:hypothetical protein